jgi:hypothetical protein
VYGTACRRYAACFTGGDGAPSSRIAAPPWCIVHRGGTWCARPRSDDEVLVVNRRGALAATALTSATMVLRRHPLPPWWPPRVPRAEDAAGAAGCVRTTGRTRGAIRSATVTMGAGMRMRAAVTRRWDGSKQLSLRTLCAHVSTM